MLKRIHGAWKHEFAVDFRALHGLALAAVTLRYA
jgi:hypothetical protein